jgi:hypothetical protein
MAGLQGGHTRACGRGWTMFEAAEGCACRPVYYIREGGRSGRNDRIGRNRREAERGG